LELGTAPAQEGSLESVGLYGEHQTYNGCREYKEIERKVNYTRQDIEEFISRGRGCRLFSTGPDEKSDDDQHKDHDPDRHMDR
jgi:hypothetical protein